MKNFKCQPTDDPLKLNCQVNGRRMNCVKRKNEEGHLCQGPPDSSGMLTCNPIDYLCYLDSKKIEKIYYQEKIKGQQYFYYFSYAEHHLQRLIDMYQQRIGGVMPQPYQDVVLNHSKAATLMNYTRSFFGTSRWGGRFGSGSLSTISSKTGKTVKGLAVLLPIEMLKVLDQDRQVKEGKFRRIIVDVKHVLGPREMDQTRRIIRCLTYIGNNSGRWYISTNKVEPSFNYLVEMATMFRDRREIMGKNLYQNVYRINILRNDELKPMICAKLRYTPENKFVEESCKVEEV